MVVVVEVPLVWEVPPRGGLVVVTSGAARFLGFVGFGLVFQDLRDDPAVGFGGEEDLREDQWVRWSGGSFSFVFLDPPRLCSGRGGVWWWWRQVGVPMVALDGGRRVRWQGVGAGDGRGDEGLVVIWLGQSARLVYVAGALVDVVGPRSVSPLLEPTGDSSVVFE